MDLIPVTDNQEYIVCDRNLIAIQLSDNIQKYTDRAIVLGEDIRESIPEIIGLESTCAAILAGEQRSFSLESITRTQNPPDNIIIYFDLIIKSVADYLVILLEDVTELMQLRQSLMQQLNESEITLNKLQRFEYCTNKIIASMRDVLLITTPSGKIERVNRSAIELFGYKRAQLIDRSIDNLIGNASFNHLEIYNFLLSSQETVKKIDINFTNKQQQIHIEFDCFIVPTEIKNFYNCVYIGRDITARKQAEAEIRKSLAREKELRQLKSGFISMASHEFRNPLSSILLCVQNLEENNIDNSERQFYLQSIQDAAVNMNSLLEDVLILSKAESGKQQLRLVKLNLRKFCCQIIQELTSIYGDRQIDLQYLFPREIVSLDDKNLRHILSNLLSNALKYSPSEGTVNLNISCSDVEQPKDLIIEVRDRGIGIPKASQKHLLESFYRANNVGNIPGTGLGLSIVYQAVKLYQGSIAIDSQENQGTKITVTLPIDNI